jgi:arylsulfatase A-like enzyme
MVDGTVRGIRKLDCRFEQALQFYGLDRSIVQMPKHFTMLRILFLLIPMFAINGIASVADDRPNIVFVLADDLGYGDLSCFGHPYARTPNLDKLASEGTRYEQFYVTGVTCCPSRTGFMTSRHPATYPKYMSGHGFAGRTTITELLKTAGYKTGHFGKWHIGPTTTDGTYGIDQIVTGKADKGQLRKLGRDYKLTSDAIDFLERHKGNRAPFYMNVWCHSTHFPIDPPRKYAAEFADDSYDYDRLPIALREKLNYAKRKGFDPDACLRQYLADVLALDEQVGRLLAKLDELGLRENTIVVFSSDQGPGRVVPPGKSKKRKGAKQSERAAMQARMMGAVGPLRGGKHEQLEGGVRSPLIIRWPGKVPANRVDKESVLSALDWLPTLCAITETAYEPSNFEGDDVSQTWLGKQTHQRTEPLFWKTSRAGSSVSLRWENWKLHSKKSRRNQIQPYELYDLSSDPGESTNVAEQHPHILQKLAGKAKAWYADLPKDYDKSGDRGED